MHPAVRIGNCMIQNLMRVFLGQPAIRGEGFSIKRRTGLDMLFDFRTKRSTFLVHRLVTTG